MTLAKRFFGALASILASMKLSVALLVMLGILTWLGTLEQTRSGLYEVQRKYFESFVLMHDCGRFSIPLPGANLVLCLLFVNLLAGGIVRLKKSWDTAGILIAHVGIVLLLVAAFTKHRYSDEGRVTLYEGQTASSFQSYFRNEIVITESLGERGYREHVVSQDELERARGSNSFRVKSADLPFEVEVRRFMTNARPHRAGPHSSESAPTLDGVSLVEEPPAKEAEMNIAGACVAILDVKNDTRREALVWTAESKPFEFVDAGKKWSIGMRRETHPMPFTISLAKFKKEDQPRMDMPRAFSSDVKVSEAGVERDVRISMNEPLRAQGLVLYQASWGPSDAAPGQPLFSTLAVVRNPADRWPLWACLVIAAGLCLHFARKLVRWITLESRLA